MIGEERGRNRKGTGEREIDRKEMKDTEGGVEGEREREKK